MQPKIFICYRREDSGPWAQLIHRYTVDAIGKENVFYDIDSIPPGHDFRKVIGDYLDKVDVLFVVIGPNWARIGKTKLFNNNDFVRFEIKYALDKNILITPLLVNNATIPNQDDLPIDIQDLIFRHGVKISPEKTARDCKDLLSQIQSWYQPKHQAESNRAAEENGVVRDLKQSDAFFNNKQYQEAFNILYRHRDSPYFSEEIQYKLGYQFEFGLGVEKNPSEASNWYLKAAKQGNSSAQYRMGFLLENGIGVTRNDEWAAGWYQLAANQGHSDAQNNLGRLHVHGRGVPQNYFIAADWYRKSAEQGNQFAQSNLGSAYEHGSGVQQNYYEAAKWYHLAAAQGNAIAQNNLGNLYVEGKGVPVDYFEAVKWYFKSAQQGDSFGQNNLGNMYETGRGVTKDKNQAIFWYQKSAQQGNEIAKKNLQKLKKWWPW